jgi:hypothetical protein
VLFVTVIQNQTLKVNGELRKIDAINIAEAAVNVIHIPRRAAKA